MSLKVPRRKRRRKLNLVGPSDPVELSDFIWPQLHARWWNRDVRAGKAKTDEELFRGLRTDDPEQAKDTLDHVQAIAQTAIDRAAAADRRATTIAGTVAIAASFTLGGAGVILDPTTITDATIRRVFAIVLFVTTAFFILAAIYALRSLVGTRTIAWSIPHDLPLDPGESRQKQLGMRAAHLLEDFAFNWEISDHKNRNVDRALQCLVMALVGIVVLAGLLVWYVF